MRPAPPLLTGQEAVFLDVDGTLLAIAPAPDAVRVPASLREALPRLATRHSGALALVSGRALDEVDSLFAPTRLPLAGSHGLERRDARGQRIRVPDQPEAGARLRRVLDALRRHAAAREGLLVEEKPFSAALHYRGAPALEAEARALAARLLAELGDGYALQRGKQVVEIRRAGPSKGDAIRAFLAEAPFAGRTPVFAGDDLTDEPGFATVNAAGGISIQVGSADASEARYGLPDADAVRRWLQASLG